ncbi:MAG: phosphotransferase, partial [Streptosporangiales bacterium]|nr:phosphotransferase [Streptosporangiales bacterium]
VFLDWELALWGDPVYDLAVHIHKMGYQPEERERLTSLWKRRMAEEHTTGWEHDLAVHLSHERVKSAIVDAVRYARLFAANGPFPYPEHQLMASMTAKLNAAHAVWGTPGPIAPATVDAAFRAWSGR